MWIQHRLLSDLILLLPEYKYFISYVTKGVCKETAKYLVTQRKAYSVGLTPWRVVLLPSVLVRLQSEKASSLTCIRSYTRTWLRHIHQKTKKFLGVSLTLSDIAGDITETGNTQWINSSGCRPSVLVVHSFIGVSFDCVNMRHTMLLRLNPTWHVLAVLRNLAVVGRRSNQT